MSFTLVSVMLPHLHFLLIDIYRPVGLIESMWLPTAYCRGSQGSPFLYPLDGPLISHLRGSGFIAFPKTDFPFPDNGADFRVIEILAVIMNL